MNKNLSWKALFGGGVFCYFIGQYLVSGDSIIGSAVGILALILILLGIVNLISTVLKRGKNQK